MAPQTNDYRWVHAHFKSENNWGADTRKGMLFSVILPEVTGAQPRLTARTPKRTLVTALLSRLNAQSGWEAACTLPTVSCRQQLTQ